MSKLLSLVFCRTDMVPMSMVQYDWLDVPGSYQNFLKAPDECLRFFGTAAIDHDDDVSLYDLAPVNAQGNRVNIHVHTAAPSIYRTQNTALYKRHLSSTMIS